MKHAAEMDLNHGNDSWVNSIEKEMTNVDISLEILDKSQSDPVGWYK